jgi:hypothetical protein
VLDVKLSTQTALNADEGELDVALLKAWMGMVESWELHQAPAKVRLAFFDAAQALWAESKRTKQRPRLPRERVPLADRLLSSGLAVEVEGFVEIPCVTQGWDAIETYRKAGRQGGRGKRRLSDALAGESDAKAMLSTLENTQVSHETSGTKNGTAPAPKILDPTLLPLTTTQRESATSRKRSRRCPKDWQPSLDLVGLADNLHVDLAVEIPKLRDHEFDKPRSDWDATARNWVRHAAERSRPRTSRMTADERKLEAIRRSDKLFDNWGEGHEPERSEADREQPEHALPSRLVGRANDPVRH